MRTSKPGVYAAGDVTGRDQYVYMAAYGAKLAALNALNGDSLVYDNSAMPWVVFTDPPVAGIGLTEAAAETAGFETKPSLLSLAHEIGRASFRERVCQYVYISVVAVQLKKKVSDNNI